jgi:hypothetical protein
MVEVKAGIVATDGVTDPLAVVVHVRGIRMPFAITVDGAWRGFARRVAAIGRRTMLGDVSSADTFATADVLAATSRVTATGLAASMFTMLRPHG